MWFGNVYDLKMSGTWKNKSSENEYFVFLIDEEHPTEQKICLR